MEERDKIFAAAVVDSGSYFRVGITGGKGMSVVRIRRQHPQQLQEIHRVFGGDLRQSKDAWYLNFQGQAGTDFLTRISPFLIVKQEHAQIVIDFNYHLRTRERGRLTDADIIFRQNLSDRLKKQ